MNSDYHYMVVRTVVGCSVHGHIVPPYKDYMAMHLSDKMWGYITFLIYDQKAQYIMKI